MTSTATPDMTSPSTVGQHLLKFEKRPKRRFRRLWVDMTPLAASSRLQNAFKYCTKMRRTGLTFNNRPLFKQESPTTALGRILVAQRFRSLTNWWASCSLPYDHITIIII